MTEQDVINKINQTSKTNFTLVNDKFSVYDAEENRYIAEIKVRNRFYPDCLIEKPKWKQNLIKANTKGKYFLYIVVVEPDIYVFNITKLHNKGYDFKWSVMEMPKNTEFGESENKIEKAVGMINIQEAKVV